MEPPLWLALAVVSFALLQLALYRYFRGESSSEGPATNPGARTDTGRDTGTRSGEFGFVTRDGPPSGPNADGVTCPRCGAQNERDTVYTYCRRCVEPLT